MDESTGQPPVETEVAPAPETEAPEPEAEIEETEGEEEAPEEVEYDLGGGQKVKFRADATAKEVLEQAQAAFKAVEGNWTKKHQSVAEQAKAIEAREQAVEKLAALNGEALETYARGTVLKQEIEQLQKIDLPKLWQSSPDQARRVSDTIARKQAEFSAVVNQVSEIEGKLSEAQQAEVSRRKEEGAREVEKRIPGFAEKHANEVMDYAVSKGIRKEDAANWALNPVFTEMAFGAMQYERMQAKAAEAARRKPVEATPVKPIQGTGGKPTKSLEDMTMDEYAAYRNQQERRKRA